MLAFVLSGSWNDLWLQVFHVTANLLFMLWLQAATRIIATFGNIAIKMASLGSTAPLHDL